MERKIAISIQAGDGADAVMDPRFGRAARFLIVDGEGNVERVLDNAAVTASHGAGPAAASAIREAGATDVISGRFGPKAYDTLKALGIAMWLGSEGATARGLVDDLRAGRLPRA
jgi:predicted Fe-Mo cluster-binding NifX family protein